RAGRPAGVPVAHRAGEPGAGLLPERRARAAGGGGGRRPYLVSAARRARRAPPRTPPGGGQQMPALGRGLMAAPDLLLLDEPSQGLAPRIVEQIFETIDRIRRERRLTILLVE